MWTDGDDVKTKMASLKTSLLEPDQYVIVGADTGIGGF